MPKRALWIIIIFLIFATAVRSLLNNSYRENDPLLLLAFQYGLAIFFILGLLIIAISVLRFKRVGWLLPILTVLIFLGVGIVGIMLTLPDLTHLASAQFNEKVYHLLADRRFEEDSMPVPITYIAFQCDNLGTTCRELQIVFRDEVLGEKRNYQRILRKAEFIINQDESTLYAKIDEQIFLVDTDIPIKEDM